MKLLNNFDVFFQSKYCKKYKDQADDRHHMETFMNHKHEIDKHNELYDKGIVSFSMSLNEYTDLPHHEFVTRMNGYKYSNRSR